MNKKITRRIRLRQLSLLGISIAVIIIGVHFITSSHAATPYAMSEAESGTLGGSATTQSDSLASGSSYVQFGSILSFRDSTQWPFAWTSPWNMPLGSNATYASSSTLTEYSGGINADNDYDEPVYVATSSDPLVTVNTLHINIPSDAQPAAGTDHTMVIISPDHHTAYEGWDWQSNGSGGWTVGYLVTESLSGDGLEGPRAAYASFLGGLIRNYDVDQGAIQHALAIAIDYRQLEVGPVWPASSQDSFAVCPQTDCYSGTLHMGQMVAIPPSVNVNDLGLSSDSRKSSPRLWRIRR
jgi:hypothetical protein